MFVVCIVVSRFVIYKQRFSFCFFLLYLIHDAQNIPTNWITLFKYTRDDNRNSINTRCTCITHTPTYRTRASQNNIPPQLIPFKSRFDEFIMPHFKIKVFSTHCQSLRFCDPRPPNRNECETISEVEKLTGFSYCIRIYSAYSRPFSQLKRKINHFNFFAYNSAYRIIIYVC